MSRHFFIGVTFAVDNCKKRPFQDRCESFRALHRVGVFVLMSLREGFERCFSMTLKWKVLPIISLVSLAACTVISERSDRQAWSEFQKEMHRSRSPSSVEGVALQGDAFEMPFREMLLSCGSYDSPSSCYQELIARRFDESFRKFQEHHSGLGPEAYRKTKVEFLFEHSYERTLSEVNHFHQSILSGMDLSARDHARDLLKSCEHDHEKVTVIERFDLFSGGVTEVPKEVYACLAHHWEEDMSQLLSETTERLGLKLETAGVGHWILKNQISPVYESELTAIFLKRSQTERKDFLAYQSEIFHDFDFQQTNEELLKRWTPLMRSRFPHSSVEQWILEYKERTK